MLIRHCWHNLSVLTEMKIGGLQKSTAMREYKLQQSAEFKIKMNTMHIYLTQDWAAYTGKKVSGVEAEIPSNALIPRPAKQMAMRAGTLTASSAKRQQS